MQVVEGVDWVLIYWLRGVSPRNSNYNNEVRDPPCAGHQHAFIIRGEKRSTIFCPYSMNAYTIQNKAAEIVYAQEPKDPFRRDWFIKLILKNWEDYQSFGWQKDYDTCALLLRRMDIEVPAQTMTGGGEDTRKKGGKEVGVELKKLVKLESKRGKFLKWFMDGGNSRSVREAMAEFSMTRSNALSYLFMLKKDHGIGYSLVGDIASIEFPAGVNDPFNGGTTETVIVNKAVAKGDILSTDDFEENDDEFDTDWLDE